MFFMQDLEHMTPEKPGMANPHCQFAWIWDHLGDTSLSLSLRVFPERFTWEGKTLNVKSPML